eukprot:6969295-Heterocapsa_arctica.AAC.1
MGTNETDPGCEHEDADDNADYADLDHERPNTDFSDPGWTYPGFVPGDVDDDSSDPGSVQ